jgi:hypothetical protein
MSLLDDKVSRLIADTDLFHTFLHGTATQDITTELGPVATLAKLRAALAVSALNSLYANSTSSVAYGLGDKTFRIETGKNFQPNQWIQVTGATGVMTGQVKTYTNDLITINVIRNTGGSGSAASWKLGLSAEPGIAGIGTPGKSAFQIAQDTGFAGNEAQWIASLKGNAGDSAYQVAVGNGYVGSISQWLESLKATGGAGGGETRHFKTRYAWDGGSDTTPIDTAGMDTVTASEYVTAINAATLPNKRVAGANAVIAAMGTVQKLTVYRNSVVVATVDYAGSMVLYSDTTDKGVSLSTQGNTTINEADIDSGTWTAELTGGANLARKITLTVGPQGSNKQIILDGDFATGMGFNPTFILVVPRSIDGLA